MKSRFAKTAVRTTYKVGVFVDSLNLFCACRDKWHRAIDHARLLRECVVGHELYRAFVYGVRFKSMARWTAAVEQYGFEVKEKSPAYHTDKTDADWDSGIIVDIWRMIDHIDMVVLVSGDGDFCETVCRCQELGKIVRVIGVDGCVSKKLVKAADEFAPVTRDMLLAQPLQEE